MRSKKVIIASFLILSVTAVLLLRSSPPQVEDQEVPLADSETGLSSSASKLQGETTAEDALREEASEKMQGLGNLPNKALGESQAKAYLQAPPLSKEEVKSVRKLVDIFFKYQRGKDSLNNLIRELRMSGLDPVVARDFNTFTGKMLTIRTNEALEGTRYFHAQYFEDSDLNKEPFRQHLSFELRPSRNSMEVVKKIIGEKLGQKLGTPARVRGDDWVEWKKGDDSIWVQRLGAEDISSDRHNARTAEDVGSLRIAIEQIPDEDIDRIPESAHVH